MISKKDIWEMDEKHLTDDMFITHPYRLKRKSLVIRLRQVN